MSNKEKIGWCAGVILLVILYLLSSTDLIIKEKKKEIFRVSVIVDQVNDNYYGNFREGMNMAEKKYQADVNFITLYAENDEKICFGRKIWRPGKRPEYRINCSAVPAAALQPAGQPDCRF